MESNNEEKKDVEEGAVGSSGSERENEDENEGENGEEIEDNEELEEIEAENESDSREIELPSKKEKKTRRKRVITWVTLGLLTDKTPGEQESKEEVEERSKHNFLVRWLKWEFRMAQGHSWKKGLMAPIGIETSIFKYFAKWKGKTWLGPPRIPHPFLQFWGLLGAFIAVSIIAIIQQYALDPNYTLLIGSFGASVVLVNGCPDSPLAQPQNVILGHCIGALVGVTTSKAILQGDSGTVPKPPKLKLQRDLDGNEERYEIEQKIRELEEEISVLKRSLQVLDNSSRFHERRDAPKRKEPSDLRWLAASVSSSVAILLMYWTKSLHPPAGATSLLAVIGSDTLVSMGYLYVPFAMLGATIIVIIGLLVNNIPTILRYPQYWW